MMNTTEDVSTARQRRAKVYKVAKLFTAAPLAQSDEGLNWQQMAKTPEWVFLSAVEREKFCLATGCLYYSPAIKRCIQGERIKYISETVGSKLFNDIWVNSHHSKNTVDNDLMQLDTHNDSLKGQLIFAGAYMIFLAADDKLKPYIQRLFVDDRNGSLPVSENAETAATLVKKSWNIWLRNNTCVEE